jgi:hypothetical protein
MHPDRLQQLRDIHLPPDPGWWPPAPGWWLLGAAALILSALLVRVLVCAWQRGRPVRRARRLHDALKAEVRAGAAGTGDYLDRCNELLKRLFVHGLGIDAARRANDLAWLGILDATLGAPEFTRGAGRALGNARFAPAPEADVAAVQQLVDRLLTQIARRRLLGAT